MALPTRVFVIADTALGIRKLSEVFAEARISRS